MTAFTLGDWRVEPERNRLSRRSQSIAVENKSMDVLVLLASRPGEVISNDEIIDAVWDGRPMGENPVYKCIASLRNALGDDSRSPQYIETIPRKGYRLLAAVSAVDIDRHMAASSKVNTRNIALLAAAVSLVAIAIANFAMNSDSPQPAQIPVAAAQNSIVVLPFETLGAVGENALFGYGIAEELLNRLAEMPDLHVVARHSSFVHGDEVKDIAALAEQLGVRYVLSGSIRENGDSFRVNVRLLEKGSSLVWTDSYDRDRDSFVSLQDDLADAVARGLSLNAGDTFRSRPAQTTNFDAYSFYLVGNELKKRRPRGWGPKAIDAYQSAIRLDPDFAAPYAGLAAAKLLSIRESPVSKREADAAITMAMRLDPNLAEAHSAAGLLGMMTGSGSDYRGAEVSLRRAMQLNPSLVEPRMWLSTVLTVLGKESQAMEELEKAVSIDPLNSIVNMNLGTRYHAHGRLDAAREQMKKSLLYPDAPAYAWFAVAGVERDSGRLDLALGWVKQTIRDGIFEDEASLWYVGVVAEHYAQLLMFEKANQWIVLNQQPAKSHWRLNWAYSAYVGQEQPGELEEAIRDYEATLTADKPLTLMSRSLIGRFAVRRGDLDRGIRYLAPVFEEGWVLQNAPGGGDDMVVTAQFLAVALQRSAQQERAKVLLENILEKQLAMKFGKTRILGRTLALEAITYSLLGEKELALSSFEEAVMGDWRNYYSTLGNPCWDELRGDPMFEALLARVKLDIDTQRERVLAEERIHPFELLEKQQRT